MVFSLHAVEMTIEDILRKRAKSSSTEKTTRADRKKKTPITEPEVPSPIQDAPLPELDAPPPEPEAPKKPKLPKKTNTQKEKGIIFKDVVPQVKTNLAPAGDKGKGVLEEPSPPAKRQKMTVVPDPRQASSVLETTTKPGINISHFLSFHQAVGPSDDTLATRVVASIVHSLNIPGVTSGKGFRTIGSTTFSSSAFTLSWW